MGTDLKGIFRKLSFVKKFSVVVIFLILIIMIMVNALILNYQKRALRKEMESNHRVMVKKLADDAFEPLIFMDPLRLDELVRTTAQTPECIYAGIVDNKRRIVAHTNRTLLGKNLISVTKDQDFIEIYSGVEYTQNVSEDGIVEIMEPVRAGYEVVGIATAGFSKDGINGVIENNLQGLKKNIFLISGLVMLIGIGGAIGLAKFLTTPMKKLKDKMEQVQKGNLDVEVPNDYIVDCWEVLNCREEECPAYGKKRCWVVPGTRCFGEVQGSVSEKISICKDCIVYKNSCGDEIGELIEVFNQMIRELRESIKKLEETTTEKARLEKLSALGEMSMTVAHEIKNPLNAIRGAVSYLLNNFEGEVLKEFLSIIEEETKRLNEIVTSFLTFSKPAPVTSQIADINRTVKEIIDLIQQEAQGNNIKVIMSLDEKIPSFSFDPQQIKQAILNILVNSLDASMEGDTINISTVMLDSHVHVTIKDTGTGIREEVIPEIFKPFFTTKTRGSGLGLACVERIVKDHGGEISVKSEVGKGTDFTISLRMNHR